MLRVFLEEEPSPLVNLFIGACIADRSNTLPSFRLVLGLPCGLGELLRRFSRTRFALFGSTVSQPLPRLVLSSLSEAERTASVRKVIAADQKEIGLRTIAAANKAVRQRLGTFCPRPGRQRKGGGPPGTGASRANMSSHLVGQAERLEPAEQQQSADQR